MTFDPKTTDDFDKLVGTFTNSVIAFMADGDEEYRTRASSMLGALLNSNEAVARSLIKEFIALCEVIERLTPARVGS